MLFLFWYIKIKGIYFFLKEIEKVEIRCFIRRDVGIWRVGGIII